VRDMAASVRLAHLPARFHIPMAADGPPPSPPPGVSWCGRKFRLANKVSFDRFRPRSPELAANARQQLTELIVKLPIPSLDRRLGRLQTNRYFFHRNAEQGPEPNRDMLSPSIGLPRQEDPGFTTVCMCERGYRGPPRGERGVGGRDGRHASPRRPHRRNADTSAQNR